MCKSCPLNQRCILLFNKVRIFDILAHRGSLLWQMVFLRVAIASIGEDTGYRKKSHLHIIKQKERPRSGPCFKGDVFLFYKGHGASGVSAAAQWEHFYPQESACRTSRLSGSTWQGRYRTCTPAFFASSSAAPNAGWVFVLGLTSFTPSI